MSKDLGLFVIDVDNLENIWAHWADGKYPADWEKYRKTPAIFASFGKNDRKTWFLTLEKAALIGNNFLSLSGANGAQMEMRRRPDGHFDLAVKELESKKKKRQKEE